MSAAESTANVASTPRDAAGIVFPISMALLMVYGMELYNHVLMGEPMAPATLLSPFSELLPMAAAVLLVEKLAGARIVRAAMGLLKPERLALPKGLVLGMLTCLAMCPMMSMVATLAFKHPSAATLIPLWFGTFVRNLPFALAWSLLVVRPISAAIAGRFSVGE